MVRQYWVTGNSGDARRDESIIRLTGRATEIDPGYARAWALMACAQGLLRTLLGGMGDGGLAAAEWALSLDPDLAEAHAVRADIWFRSGRQDEAAAEIATALRLDPESYEVNNTAASLSFGQRRMEDAIRYWEKAAALMETDFGSPGMLITCYTAIGDPASARRAAQLTLARAEAALAQDRSNGKALGFGVSALGILGEGERVKEWSERALLLDPDNMVMRYNFACNIAVHLKDTEAALAMLGPVVQRRRPYSWTTSKSTRTSIQSAMIRASRPWLPRPRRGWRTANPGESAGDYDMT
jgi:adenylate cyclase